MSLRLCVPISATLLCLCTHLWLPDMSHSNQPASRGRKTLGERDPFLKRTWKHDVKLDAGTQGAWAVSGTSPRTVGAARFEIYYRAPL